MDEERDCARPDFKSGSGEFLDRDSDPSTVRDQSVVLAGDAGADALAAVDPVDAREGLSLRGLAQRLCCGRNGLVRSFRGFPDVPAGERIAGVSVGIVWVTYALLAILLVIVLMALPAVRARFHNSFEKTHRFGGWAALLLFWTQSVMFINDQRGGAGLAHALLSSPGWWMLAVLTTSIALPWTRLRKVPVRIDTPSSHAAIVRFDHGVTPFPGSSTAVSRHPLFEWHSFANIPAPRENGFRLIVSRAGDWSGSFIDDAPSHVWVKGIPTAGVANIETLFTRVVYVATGSGIGPVLPHLLAKRVPARLVWSTRALARHMATHC